MKEIFHTVNGSMLVTDSRGMPVPKPILVEASDPEPEVPGEDRLLLRDRVTGKVYEIYVDAGRLQMEVI